MNEDQRRGLAQTTAQASQAVRPSGLTLPVGASSGQHSFNSRVKQILETGLGVRGTPFDKWITRREMDGGALPGSQNNFIIMEGGVPAGAGVPITGPGGSGWMSFDDFARSIMSTKLFRDLTAAIDDPHRFDDLPEKTRNLLLQSVAEEASKRGAAIRRMDEKFQNATESFAQSVTEVTAAVDGASAGVRQVLFAYASQNRAVAGIVTQVQARLNNFSGGAPGVATIEQKMTAIADRSTGLEAQYVLKVATNGAIAGFGVAATTTVAGASTSAMLFLANKFAFITGSDVIGTGPGQVNPISPPASRIIFGIDSDGAYVGGNLKVSGISKILGKHLSTSGDWVAMEVNSGFNANSGIISWATGAAGQAGLIGQGLAGADGVRGHSTNGIGINGTGLGVGGIGGFFLGLFAGAIAIKVDGTFVRTSGSFSSSATGVATFTGTKPGGNTSNQWMEMFKDGAQGWIPWYPHT